MYNAHVLFFVSYLCFWQSSACSSIAKPGKHFLIETDDAPEKGGADDYQWRPGGNGRPTGDYQWGPVAKGGKKECDANKKWCTVETEKKDCEPNKKSINGGSISNSACQRIHGSTDPRCQPKIWWRFCTCQPSGKEVECYVIHFPKPTRNRKPKSKVSV